MGRRYSIRYLADLHTEFWGELQTRELRSIGEDLVVLAGDIGLGLQGIHWALRHFGDRPTVYVFGNHEYYGYDWTQLVNEAKAYTHGTQLRVLECDEVEIAGLRVLGCSLWTDFDLYGVDRREETLKLALKFMSDYEEIRHEGRGLIPIETRERCLQHYAWLRETLARNDKPTLVVTHHAPSIKTSHPFHEGQLTNAFFHSNFDQLFEHRGLLGWIHGHTHYSTSVEIEGVPLVTNQRGYPGEERWGFSWAKTLELELPDDVDGGVDV